MEIYIRKFIIAALWIFLLTTISCEKKTAKNSENIILNEIMDYNWNTPIEEIEENFIDKNYKEIKIESDLITAKGNYYGLNADIFFSFFNGEMYVGGISYLGFPEEPDEKYTLQDIYNIQERILSLFSKKYGAPQEIKEKKEEYEGEIRYYKWNFKNNCQLELRLEIKYFILIACWLDVRFINNAVYEEKKLADELKEDNSDIESSLHEKEVEIFDENEIKKIMTSGQKITMTGLKSDNMEITMGGSGILIIDWGDGTAKDVSRFSEKVSIQDYKHNYSGKSSNVINIYGENIKNLNCSGHSGYQEMSALDVSMCATLANLDCGYNQLTYLNVNNASLEELRCQHNELSNLDLSGAVALKRLDCGENQLTSLDLCNNKALKYLQCNDNQIEYLDIRNNTELWELKCSNNLLTGIDIGKNKKLQKLECGDNFLTNLDVKDCKNLIWLDLRINIFTNLDIRTNTKLELLIISDNKFPVKALNSIFRTLPKKKESENFGNVIIIGNNPGTNNCNIKMAARKGWNIQTYGFEN